ncbi:hypothetical protein VCRA2113O325_110148 [Vibrio crassostreae]|nr:hypothetical protein VCRA2110O182_110116 [Vibrio crassostreae]CAK2541149.1 hypothetical protein VCRA2113O323_110148 [Vibrio crassostreae]CAK2596048.1 hypothetical protein VCRA2113O325_110148 [Vibrio crassostreae]CAK3313820.1 hypothetical protein VCRA2125O343_130029 [Vibrio crassostreae]
MHLCLLSVSAAKYFRFFLIILRIILIPFYLLIIVLHSPFYLLVTLVKAIPQSPMFFIPILSDTSSQLMVKQTLESEKTLWSGLICPVCSFMIVIK